MANSQQIFPLDTSHMLEYLLPMRFSVLASGSRANCTFVEGGRTRILIDAGLSARETERRLRPFGISLRSIHAIIVTHEHLDHIKGVVQISRTHEIPVFANKGTAKFLRGVHALEMFRTGAVFPIGDIIVHPFELMHDAADPVGFLIESGGASLAHVTDLGTPTEAVSNALASANAAVLESNHDVELLQACHYPWPLKNRIASSHGHLSNEASAALFSQALHMNFRHLVLGHISENSNTPETALAAFRKAVDSRNLASIRCAGPGRATEMIHITDKPLLEAVSMR